MKFLHELYRPYGKLVKLKMTNYSFNLMILVYLIQKKILPYILEPSDPDGWITYEMQYPSERNPRFGSTNVSSSKPLSDALSLFKNCLLYTSDAADE